MGSCTLHRSSPILPHVPIPDVLASRTVNRAAFPAILSPHSRYPYPTSAKLAQHGRLHLTSVFKVTPHPHLRPRLMHLYTLHWIPCHSVPKRMPNRSDPFSRPAASISILDDNLLEWALPSSSPPRPLSFVSVAAQNTDICSVFAHTPGLRTSNTASEISPEAGVSIRNIKTQHCSLYMFSVCSSHSVLA